MKIDIKKEYLEEFNLLRGIAVVLVVLGHSFIGGVEGISKLNYIHKIIYSFHMPIFFFISGFFATKLLELRTKKEKLKFLKIKFLKLIVPYFSITILAIPIKLLLNSFVNRPIILSELLVDVILYPMNNPVVSLWFIYSLFIIFIISIILNKFKGIMRIVLGVIMLIFCGIYKIAIFNFYGICRNIIFFLIGLNIKGIYTQMKKVIEQKKYIIVSISFIVLVCLNTINTANNILTEVLYLLTGLSGIVLTLSIAISISENRIKFNLLNLIGYYSFDIYVFSWFTQNIIGYGCYKILNINYYIVMIITFFSGFIPILISKFIIGNNGLMNKIFLGKYDLGVGDELQR